MTKEHASEHASGGAWASAMACRSLPVGPCRSHRVGSDFGSKMHLCWQARLGVCSFSVLLKCPTDNCPAGVAPAATWRLENGLDVMGAEILPEEAPSAPDHSASFSGDPLALARAGAAAGRSTTRSVVLRKEEARAPVRPPQVRSGPFCGPCFWLPAEPMVH